MINSETTYQAFREAAYNLTASFQYLQIPREDVEVTIKFKTFQQRDQWIYNLGTGISQHELVTDSGLLDNTLMYAGVTYKFEVEEKRFVYRPTTI